MTDAQENSTPSKSVAALDAEKYFPQLVETLEGQNRSIEELGINELHAYETDPMKFINGLKGMDTFKDPDAEKAKQVRAQEISDARKADALMQFAEGFASAGLAIGTGGLGSIGGRALLGGAAKILPKVGPKAAQVAGRIGAFAGDTVGAATGDILGSQLDEGAAALRGEESFEDQRAEIDPFFEGRDQDILGDFETNVALDAGIAAGGKTFAGIASALGVDAKRISGWFRSMADHTDPDMLLADSVSLSSKDFIAKYDGKTLKDAVEAVKDPIFKDAPVDAREKLFPVIEQRIASSKKVINTDIDGVLGKVEEVAIDRGLESNVSVRDLLDPVEAKLDDFAGDAEVSALRSVYKKEKTNFARQILDESEFNDYVEAEKIIRKTARKESKLRITSLDAEDLRKRTAVAFKGKEADRVLKAIDTYEELNSRVLDSNILTLDKQRTLKKQYSKEASFNSDLLQDSEKQNRAAAYGVFEDSVRTNLEKTIQDISPEHFDQYKNLNTAYSNLKQIEPNVKYIAAAERGTLTPGIIDNVRSVFALNREGVSGRGFLSHNAEQKVGKATQQALTALDLYDNPAIIKHAVGDTGASLLMKYSRSSVEFFRPRNVQALTSVGGAIINGEISADEAVTFTLDKVRMALEEGMKAGEEQKQQIMMNLLSDPETAPLFRDHPAQRDDKFLADIKSVVDDKILDPMEQEGVRQRVLKDFSIPTTKKFHILNELNKNGSIKGFQMEPTPQPVEPEGDKTKKSTAALNDRVRTAISKNKAVREIVKQRRTDSVVEYSRQ